MLITMSPTVKKERENVLPANVIKNIYLRWPIVAWVVIVVVVISTVGGAVNFLTGKDLPGLLPQRPSTNASASYEENAQSTTTVPSSTTTQQTTTQAVATKKSNFIFEFFRNLFKSNPTNPDSTTENPSTTTKQPSMAKSHISVDEIIIDGPTVVEVGKPFKLISTPGAALDCSEGVFVIKTDQNSDRSIVEFLIDEPGIYEIYYTDTLHFVDLLNIRLTGNIDSEFIRTYTVEAVE